MDSTLELWFWGPGFNSRRGYQTLFFLICAQFSHISRTNPENQRKCPTHSPPFTSGRDICYPKKGRARVVLRPLILPQHICVDASEINCQLLVWSQMLAVSFTGKPFRRRRINIVLLHMHALLPTQGQHRDMEKWNVNKNSMLAYFICPTVQCCPKKCWVGCVNSALSWGRVPRSIANTFLDNPARAEPRVLLAAHVLRKRRAISEWLHETRRRNHKCHKRIETGDCGWKSLSPDTVSSLVLQKFYTCRTTHNSS